MTRRQLLALGVGRGQVEKWIKRGILLPSLPGVFAVGYASASQESRLWEAVLYAGPGAMLSHLTAAPWCGLIKYVPVTIQVSTPRKVVGLAGIEVHARRPLERFDFKGLPVALYPQILLDLALERPDLLQRALGQLDFQGRFEPNRIEAALGKGRRGTTVLRRALGDYDPAYADLNDEFEINFYALCRAWGIDPLPIPNVEIEPHLFVDALWPEHHLAVELDGGANHHSRAQLLRDADRDLICRRHGLTVIRYRREQLRRAPDSVCADLLAQLARAGGQRLPSGR